LLTPVFSAGLNYQLFRNTLLSAGASRSVTPSYFGNQVEVATTVGASIAQRLSPKLSLSLNAGYSTEPLIGIVPGQPLPQYFLGTPPRTALVEDEEQNSTSVGVGLSYAVLQRVAIAAFYSVSQNSSSQSNYKYSSSQIGFSVSYSY
jgi:opacity protein-like surface antigen